MAAYSRRDPALLEVNDPGAAGTIPIHRHHHMVCSITTAGAEARAFGDPIFPGQCLTLILNVDGGDATVTADSAVNQAGNNTLTFADAGDHIKLEGALLTGAYVWRVVANDGVALSTV